MASLITVAATAALLCEPSAKNICSVGRCETVPVTNWAMVDQANGTYSRCDKTGCDTNDAVFGQSGAYRTIEVAGRGLIARIGSSGEFVEIATLGTAVYVSHGQCRVAP